MKTEKDKILKLTANNPTPKVLCNPDNPTPGPSPMGRGEKRDNLTPGYITTDSVTYKKLKPFTLENRKNQTKAESILWEATRNKKLGIKFRRQHAIEKYIVDFVCLTEKIIIEVDGDYHTDNEQIEYDKIRTETFKSLDYSELRFWNEDVIKNLEAVVKEIKYFLDYGTSPPAPLQQNKDLTSPPPPLQRRGEKLNIRSETSPPQRGGIGGGIDE
ncbi:MAG: endonuclease domain-containing protein [Bacteroidota bacterium]|nr:endonuclease domain-containing protein [Bacteroidota bacterium]